MKFVNGYRGVARLYIEYPYQFSENDEIMKIFRHFDSITSDDIYLHDIEFAKKIKNIYEKTYPNIKREIIEVVFDDQTPELGNSFLGYDIADGIDSNVLVILFNHMSNIDFTTHPHPIFSKVIKLISNNLIRFLNSNELFDNWDDAKMGLNLLQGTFEIFGMAKKHHEFKIAKLYSVA